MITVYYNQFINLILNLSLNISTALQSDDLINKRVAGICHHDYEGITINTNADYFTAFAAAFPGDGQMTARFEMDIFNIYDCSLDQLNDSIVSAAQFNIDQLQAAGYDVRIWFTEMPTCLGFELPQLFIDLIPDAAGLIRPHVMPSKDPEQYQAIIEDLVRVFTIDRSTSGKEPVTLYEGWNEIESPGYFFGTRELFVDNILIPMIKAVNNIEAELGYELHFASHSVANGSEGFTTNVNVEVNNMIETRGFEVDWINWHWYGTFPFHHSVPPDLYSIMNQLERENPWATPKEMGRQTRRMKTLFPDKQLMISEWNWGCRRRRRCL